MGEDESMFLALEKRSERIGRKEGSGENEEETLVELDLLPSSFHCSLTPPI